MVKFECGVGVDFVFGKVVVVASAVPSFVLPRDFANLLYVIIVVGDEYVPEPSFAYPDLDGFIFSELGVHFPHRRIEYSRIEVYEENLVILDQTLVNFANVAEVIKYGSNIVLGEDGG